MIASSTLSAPAAILKRELARVFPYPGPDDGAPRGLTGLSLDNHVGHVTELARLWDNERAYGAAMAEQLARTKDRLTRAARRHDEGKPQTFRLFKQHALGSRRTTLTYSFRGHRFLVIDDDPYGDWLIRLHHEYDVDTITEAQAALRRLGDEGKILARCFPYDLYTLEMCDQIDAEASSCALAPDTTDRDRDRPFMEYHSVFERGTGMLLLDPWPFAPESIALDYPSFKVAATTDCDREWAASKVNDRLPAWEALATSGSVTEQPEVALTLTMNPNRATWTDGRGRPAFYGGVAKNIGAPNPMQEHVRRELSGKGTDQGAGQAPRGDGFVLLKAPTGSGKTEAVLAPALEGERRLFLILPSRALVEDQQARIAAYLEEASREAQGRRSLIVDTGDHDERTVWVKGVKDEEARGGRRHHLYDADVVVTTLDSFLFRFFAFGGGRKSYIFPLRIQLQRGETPLQRGETPPLFCFDEAHSYDTLAWQNFLNLVEALACDMALDVVVMSATVSDRAQKALERLGATVLDYASGAGLDALRAYQDAQGNGRPHPDTTLRYHPCAKGEEVDRLKDLALREWRPGRRVIAAAETVRDAVELHAMLQESGALPADGDAQNLYLYHGRLDSGDRRKRYGEIAARDKQQDGPGYLLVTTSAIEVGCDLDAHVLLTTFCYPEQLVQRAGRCNRRAQHAGAALHVVGASLATHASSLSQGAREQLQARLTCALQRQNGGAFDAAAIVDLIVPDLTGDDRAAVLYSLLSDYVYEGDRTAKPAHDKGLVLTRSWEPSITLYEDNGRGGRLHEVQIPLSRCVMRRDDIAPTHDVRLEREYYDEERREMVREPLRFGGCCYLHRLVAQAPPGTYDEVNGFAAVPRFLRRRGGRGYRTTVEYDCKEPATGAGIADADAGDRGVDATGTSVRTVRLWYLEALPSSTAAAPVDPDERGNDEEPSVDANEQSAAGGGGGEE